MISECEKEYLVEIKRIVKEIDQRRDLAASNKEIKGAIDLLKFDPFS